MSDTHRINVRVNGEHRELEVEGDLTLAVMLRHRLQLTGTHLGYEHVVCGACTVLVDGRSARSCLMLAVHADGKSVEMVESLGGHGSPSHPLPGMLTTLVEFRRASPGPTRAAVREAISGNLCRCTGYQGIVDATLAAAKALANEADR